MDRVNRILNNNTYKTNLDNLKELEKNRTFCRHGLEHLLDVARLAYIENLEKGLGIDKSIIYATALLHDLGRVLEYKENLPHDKASVLLAKKILPECGFGEDDIKLICMAIGEHKNIKELEDKGLCGLIYRADKKSRNCFYCNAIADCKWSKEKKNYTIES
jgi:uncharacterized protein